jgi:hypothetical protein
VAVVVGITVIPTILFTTRTKRNQAQQALSPKATPKGGLFVPLSALVSLTIFTA